MTIFDPATTRQDPNNPAQYIRTPFVGNRIPAARIDPVSAKIQTYYPAPTSAGTTNTGLNNFFFSGSAKRATDNYSGRIDHQLSTSTMLTARISRANLSTWQNPATFGESNLASPDIPPSRNIIPHVLGKATTTFSPTLFGEFVFSWARWFYQSFGLSNGFDPTQLGFPSYLAEKSIALGFPSIATGEMSALGGYFNEYDVSDRYEGKANLSKLAGKHTLKFGGMYGLGKYTTNLANNSAGAYSSSRPSPRDPIRW